METSVARHFHLQLETCTSAIPTARNPFSGVQSQGRDSQAGGFAGDIRGSDVAAAHVAYVLASENANEDVSEGNRSQQVGDDDGEDEDEGHEKLLALSYSRVATRTFPPTWNQ